MHGNSCKWGCHVWEGVIDHEHTMYSDLSDNELVQEMYT